MSTPEDNHRDAERWRLATTVEVEFDPPMQDVLDTLNAPDHIDQDFPYSDAWRKTDKYR